MITALLWSQNSEDPNPGDYAKWVFLSVRCYPRRDFFSAANAMTRDRYTCVDSAAAAAAAAAVRDRVDLRHHRHRKHGLLLQFPADGRRGYGMHFEWTGASHIVL